MCEIDAATKYKFESLLGKPAREIAFILGEPDKWEGYGYIRPVYVLDDGSYDKEYNNLSSHLALNNDYDGFWDMVRAYIDRKLS